VQKLRRARAPPLLEKAVRAHEGTTGLERRKPLKRRCQAERVGKKAQKRKAFGKPFRRPWGREKALERKAHERGKLRKASEGNKADTAKRVAKP
jgi:hypothetical protein